MKNREGIPCVLYLYIHYIIYKSKGKYIKFRDLRDFLSEWRIPKKLRYIIIKELEKLNLLTLKNCEITVNKPEFEFDKIDKYYDSLGIWAKPDKFTI